MSFFNADFGCNIMNNKEKKRILVVCMGNICRSPTAEAVLRATAERLGIDVEVDSAGTIDFHVGDQPDYRARTAGENRGYSFAGMQARMIEPRDFAYFDLILAADSDNLDSLMALCPPEHAHKVRLFMSYSDSPYSEIPDPYYGGENGFELVLDLIEQASEVILTQ